MKWIILSICLFIWTNSYSQSEFQTEEELIEYISGVWNMDSLYGGWIGLHHVPTSNFLDSSYVHFQFIESDVPETPLLFRYYLNGELFEETSVTIKKEEELSFVGYWFLETNSETFFLDLIVFESYAYPTPFEENIQLAENAYDANSYYLSKCFPEFDVHGTPLLTQYPDEDGDGFGLTEAAVYVCEKIEGYIYEGDDCDDQDSSINPLANELPGNDVDEDCDGEFDTTSTEENDLSQLRIYPNPVEDFVYLSSDKSKKFKASLYTIHGNFLCSYDSPNKIEMSEYPAACYILKYTFDDGENQKIVKIVKN